MYTYNHEGYADPTPHQAMLLEHEARLDRYRPIVYICSPLRGDIQGNINNACRYALFTIRKRAIPFAPHLHYTLPLTHEIFSFPSIKMH